MIFNGCFPFLDKEPTCKLYVYIALLEDHTGENTVDTPRDNVAPSHGLKVVSYYSVVNIYKVVTSFSSPMITLPGINSSYMVYVIVRSQCG